MIAEIPRLPVIHARARIKHNTGIRPRRAGKFIEQARGKHRPLATIGMADNPNAVGIHLRPLRQHMPRIGRRTAEHRERLHSSFFNRGIICGIRAVFGRLSAPDRQSHKTATRQLYCVVAKRIVF